MSIIDAIVRRTQSINNNERRPCRSYCYYAWTKQDFLCRLSVPFGSFLSLKYHLVNCLRHAASQFHVLLMLARREGETRSTEKHFVSSRFRLDSDKEKEKMELSCCIGFDLMICYGITLQCIVSHVTFHFDRIFWCRKLRRFDVRRHSLSINKIWCRFGRWNYGVAGVRKVLHMSFGISTPETEFIYHFSTGSCGMRAAVIHSINWIKLRQMKISCDWLAAPKSSSIRRLMKRKQWRRRRRRVCGCDQFICHGNCWCAHSWSLWAVRCGELDWMHFLFLRKHSLITQKSTKANRLSSS